MAFSCCDVSGWIEEHNTMEAKNKTSLEVLIVLVSNGTFRMQGKRTVVPLCVARLAGMAFKSQTRSLAEKPTNI